MPISPRQITLCSYRYDALDRSISWTPIGRAGIQRFHCKDRLATEIQGVAKCSIFQHDNQVLAQQQHRDARVDTTLLATDQQQSVLNTLNANRPHPLVYSPYGHRLPGNGLLSLLGFNGERRDPVTGNYHLGNGYRQFSPVLMRFNSPDCLSPFGKGGMNAYAYCIGDPVNRTDPTGHAGIMEALEWVGKKFGFGRSKTSIHDMPTEILYKILGDFEGKDLAKVSQTSPRMNDFVKGMSANNMMKIIDKTPDTQLLPALVNVGIGKEIGVAPSAAVQSGISLADAQRNYPTILEVEFHDRAFRFGPLPLNTPRPKPVGEEAIGIRSGNWF